VSKCFPLCPRKADIRQHRIEPDPAQRYSDGWSRAVERAGGAARSTASGHNWDEIVEQVNDELPDGLG
jgi:hypothetical protein